MNNSEQWKAITVYQPWASLAAIGAKKYETRGWATKYRGKIAIHAGKQNFRDLIRALPVDTQRAMYAALYGAYGLKSGAHIRLAAGAIIATAELTGCYSIASQPRESMFRDGYCFMFYTDKSNPYSTEPLDAVKIQPNISVKYGLDEQERIFGDWTPGRYAWELANVKPLSAPIPCAGRQRLWNVPDDIAAQFEAA
jgi:hypothetical protein